MHKVVGWVCPLKSWRRVSFGSSTSAGCLPDPVIRAQFQGTVGSLDKDVGLGKSLMLSATGITHFAQDGHAVFHLDGYRCNILSADVRMDALSEAIESSCLPEEEPHHIQDMTAHVG